MMDSVGFETDGYDTVDDYEISEDGKTCTFTMPSSDLRVNAEYTQPAVPYYDENGKMQDRTSYTYLSNVSGYTLKTGWYVVDKYITHSERITIKGDVHIILAYVNEWHAEKGIYVPADAKFTVFTQNGDSGYMKATGSLGRAGIGGNERTGYGDITIYGGSVTVEGGRNAAGIGGG